MEVVITPDDDWFLENPDESDEIEEEKTNRYHPDGQPPGWEDTAPSEYEPPWQESDWFINSIPLNEHPPYSGEYHSPLPTGGETMHEKMYKMATKNGGSWIGGSENQQGGSENFVK